MSSIKSLSYSFNVCTLAYKCTYFFVCTNTEFIHSKNPLCFLLSLLPSIFIHHLPLLCFFCWNFLKWDWMVVAAFSTSTGLSGGTAGVAHVPLMALESEHDRTQGIAREAGAIAMETLSVAVIKFKHMICMLAWIFFRSVFRIWLDFVLSESNHH